MTTLFKSIKIPSEIFEYKNGETSTNRIDNLSKINFIVGSNNSGKSLFLRTLLNCENLEYTSNNISIEKYNVAVRKVKEKMLNFIDTKKLGGGPFDNVKKSITDLKEREFDSESEDLLKPFEKIRDSIKMFISQDINWYTATGDLKSSEIYKVLITVLDESLNEFAYEPILSVNKIYIPNLRGMIPLQQKDPNIEPDTFEDRVKQDHFRKRSQNKRDFDIFTGLKIREKIKNSILRGDTEILNKYQEYLSENFFFGEKVYLSPQPDNGNDSKKDILNVKIGRDIIRPMYDLGDGIQSIIILTFPLFFRDEKPTLYFIEEPENFIHPGLQRRLIETLIKDNRLKNSQFFFTTHSNHFLDLAMDFSEISIFGIKKHYTDDNKNRFIINRLFEGDKESLELLGVRNTSVFLSNCTIWVEGTTDRHYFRHYLDLYQKSLPTEEPIIFREDTHYSFVEYGGNNITHWSFLDESENSDDKKSSRINVERLCGKLFLIADRDKNTKTDRHQKLKEKLGDRFCLLECREVENLLSWQILTKVVESYGDEIGNFSEQDYKEKYLGEFLDEIVDRKKKPSPYGNPIEKGTGTIKDKVAFCKKVIEFSNNWSDLSEEAKKITIRIYNFIKENNSN